MTDIKIYTPKWTYDVWTDIEGCFPRGSIMDCEVKSVERHFAFLKGALGVTCFLSKAKVAQLWVVEDLRDEIRVGEHLKCKVIDYNLEKRSVNVSLKLN